MRTIRVLVYVLAACSAALALASQHEAASLQAQLAAADRPEGDKARDGARKPADVLEFLGITRGQTVMDVIASGGYYTEVLSIAVGPEGTVYAQNPSIVLLFREGANDKALTARLSGGRLGNVRRWDRELDDLALNPGTLDAALTALNFHDVYNNNPDEAVEMLRSLHALLRPGGVLGVIDHVGVAGADNVALHRVEKDKVIAAAREAGFELAGESTLLASAADDHSGMVFAPALRSNTDRFLLKLVKPG